MEAKKKKRRRRATVRLWLDYANELYWSVPAVPGKVTINVPVSESALRQAKRGYPWTCWLAEAIKDHHEENPDAYPHAMLYVYVTRAGIYIIDKMKGATPSHCVQYRHNFGKLIGRFDEAKTLAKYNAFLASIRGEDLTLVIRPGIKRRLGQPKGHGGYTGGPRTMVLSRGARRRAEEAGLLPPRTGKLTDEERYV